MTTLEKIEAIKKSVKSRFVHRDELVDAVILSILSGADMLAIGPPGCAKSAVIKDVLQHFDLSKFSRQLNQFSTDKDLLGDINPKKFMDEGIRVHEAPNTLLDCDIAFVDEVFKGTKGARAALLEPLADRQFSENGNVRDIPLLAMLTASNELPSDSADAAFYSRLQIRVHVKDLSVKSAVKEALWGDQPEPTSVTVTRDEVLALRATAQGMKFSRKAKNSAMKIFAEVEEMQIKLDQRKRMRAYGSRGSLAQCQAVLNGNDEVLPEDLSVGSFVFWSKPAQAESVNNAVKKYAVKQSHEATEKFNEVVEYFETKPIQGFDDDQIDRLLNMARIVRAPNYWCKLNGEQRDQLKQMCADAGEEMLKRGGGSF